MEENIDIYGDAKHLIDVIRQNAENLHSDLNHLNIKFSEERIPLMLQTLSVIKECSEALGRMIVAYAERQRWLR